MTAILTLNAGSSSLKFGVYEATPEPDLLCVGQVESLGANATLAIKGQAAEPIGDVNHATALEVILPRLAPILADREVVSVGHRVVHGGPEFTGPVELTAEVLERLSRLEPFAPLHQPHNLAAVRTARAVFPDAVQIGCFDTAFHAGHPFVNDTFAIPRRFYKEGIRRYGFHGLSYDYITSRLSQDYPELAKGRVVVAHLGNGASMCAIRNGNSIGSTMGLSALDGLPMGTRCGQLDPGVLLYLMEQGMSADEITYILYRESGLKGLSELSQDMRTLLDSPDPRAAEAIDYYVFRLRRELGAMAAVLGGLDALVFCGGVGENAVPIRARALEGMGFLGLDLDETANAANATEIGRGPTRVLVIPTDEERVIARAVANALGVVSD